MDNESQTTALSLLKVKRFLPLFITQFLGAFNDNLYKMAMITLITYSLAAKSGTDEATLSNLAAGLFILPYFLASAVAGQLADKFEKTTQVIIIKLWEVGLMIIGAVGFYTENIVLLMAVLFGMGLQSTFFGPIKYAILPTHLKDNELLAGNSLIEAGTFLAILLGMIAGGLLILSDQGLLMTTVATIGCAVIGVISAIFIPKTGRADPDLRIRKNVIAETFTQFKQVKQSSSVFLSIIGISWFWMFGSVFMAQISPIAKNILHVDNQVMTYILALFSIGIGFGSILCNRLLKGEISGRYQTVSLLVMMMSGVLLYWILGIYQNLYPDLSIEGLMTFGQFLSWPPSWIISFAVIGIAAAGGVHIVPLYARLQHQSDPDKCSRTIAANNVMNSLWMVLGAAGAILVLKSGLGIAEIILIISLINIPIALILKPISQ